ncbi:MAG: glycosyltransferase family 4 protein [Mycobacteriales bacterium]
MTAPTRGGESRDQSLRVALVAPPWFEVPPQGYGGIEALCADLADGLVACGHEVHLFASGSRGTDAHFIRTYEDPPSERVGDPILEMIHAARVAAAMTDMQLDIVHDHTLAGPLLARARRCPTMLTVHGPLDGELGDYLELLGSTVHLVAISAAQRRSRPELNWAATIPNALRVADYPFRAEKEDYALFLGRMNPEKGAHVAIEVAREAGCRLLIAAKCNEPAEQAYFDEQVAPRLGDGVEWLGEADADRKRQLLGAARCLLFPLRWEEPFGLVMIEALACGTPVVALRRGSVPEIVVDGVTGYVRDDAAELPPLLSQVDALDAKACRRRAEEEFDLPVMISRYEQAYRAVIAGHAGESALR